jgi:type IV pilus biogenesis protein CpaD/CtpE
MKRLCPVLLLAALLALAAGCTRSASSDGTSNIRDDSMTTSPAGRTRLDADQKYYLWADPP